MSSIKYLSESTVGKYLTWDILIPAMEKALLDTSKKDGSVIQPTRLMMFIPEKQGVFLAMPGYSKEENSLGCKLVTSFVNNKEHELPSVLSNIFLFDGDTGKIKVILEANTITGWRTAAVSAVSTKYIHKGAKDVLAILGAGTQAKTHALALQHLFTFKEVRIWNRHKEGAEKLQAELPFASQVFSSNEECVAGADVICTTTYATSPILKEAWVKNGAHVNAIGAGINHHSELEEALYKKSIIVVDSLESAEKELKGLRDLGLNFWSEIGEIISGKKKAPEEGNVTIFHSLGLAIEDVITANLIYEIYLKSLEAGDCL